MTKRTLSIIAASFVIATGLFWARMLTSPPVSEAATNPGINVGQIAFNAPENLPSFDDTYQRHTGVLDTLRRWAKPRQITQDCATGALRR
jgi:hypothetical protein